MQLTELTNLSFQEFSSQIDRLEQQIFLKGSLFIKQSSKPVQIQSYEVPQKFSFPEEEKSTLEFWNQKKCFEKQLQLTKHLPPYTFYDGPPFATGTPHYGHIAAGTIKDVVCRYASQTGHYVSRRFGWDCHGLPVEYEIDKALKITDKKQVTEMGIAKYNDQCRKIVMKYSSEWENVISRFGRWIDFKNDYKTLDIKFMESVWYVFKQLFQKGLVYRGRKIMPYSNACSTVLSNFQVQLNYKQVSDPSLYVSFPLVEDNSVKFMVWTTTPWTLPSNLALAVKADMDYVKIRDTKKNQIFILAESRLKAFYGKDKKAYEILQKMKGKDLEGKQYLPMFDFFKDRKVNGCFKVLAGDFVTDDSGTGIVHCAPGFGQEDYKLCVSKGIIQPDNPPVPIDDNGKFTKQCSTYQNLHLKDADKVIIKDIKQKGRLVQSGTQVHNYPYCWRSDTPLIYKAVSTWFIKVTDFKQDLVKNNHKAYWVPKSIQQKRFDNWLKEAKDWCFSRNRYWGNPIPIWVSDDGQQIVCIGSLKELQQLTGQKVTDLHRQHIDHLTIESRLGKGKLKRIDEVFDCWFESGSMPYAQVHYPFSTSEEEFSKIFPADFIGEGIDQTRGWFYTLNVISTGLKNMNPYKNLIVNGLVLTQDGKKMSKRLKNYPDPLLVCDEFGADAIRLYLINSPLVRADNLNFSKLGVKSVVRQIFLPWFNAYRFLIQNISKWETKEVKQFEFIQNMEELHSNFNVTDQWIQSSLQLLIKNVHKQMSQYKLYNVVTPLISFLQNLTNWYVRLNRLRLKGQVEEIEMRVSLNVLFDVLLKINVLMSPFVPFLTESMFQNMKKVIKKDSKLYQESIHHLTIPEVNEKFLNETINQKMKDAMSIIQTARKLRQIKKISLKQPIISITIINKSQTFFQQLSPFMSYIQEEVNAAQVKNQTQTVKYMKYEALPNLPSLGPKFKGNKDFKSIADQIKKLSHQALEKCKEERFVKILSYDIQIADIIIRQKFVDQNIHQFQCIGGDRVIVLLNTTQNEELKVKGYARQIINRIQKLKKKVQVKTDDQIFIFWKFSQNSKNLHEAMDKQNQMIRTAVKKTLISYEKVRKDKVLGEQAGKIDEQQQYQLAISYAFPLINHKALSEDFAGLQAHLQEKILSENYLQIKNKESIQIQIQKTEYVLLKGRHYEILL